MKLPEDSESRWGLPIAILLIAAFVGGLIAQMTINNALAFYSGASIGLLVGLLVLIVIWYASSSFHRKSVMLLAVSLMIMSVFSVVMPVHADYVLGWQFGPGDQNVANTEPCQTLDVANSGGGTANMEICAGLAARIYKDASETDSTHDDYLIDMRVFAINGTNDDCFIGGVPCNYPITATSLYNIRIGISGSSNTIWGDAPGVGCPSIETPVSPTFSGVAINFLLPAMCTSWNTSPNYNWNVTIPSDSTCWIGAGCNPNVLATNGQYADFYVEIAVPEAASFTASFSSRITLTYCAVPQYSCAAVNWANAGYNLSGSLYVDPSTVTQLFSMSPGSSTVDRCPGVTTAGQVTFSSLNGFSGTISVSEKLSGASQYVSPDLYPTSLTLTSSGSGSTGFVWAGLWSQDSDFSQGTYTVTVTGTSGSFVSQVSFSIVISYNYCPSKGGGGSVAYGTLITLADGSQAPAQNLHAGMNLLSYDLSTNQYVVTTIAKFSTVMTDNQMVI